MFLATTKDPKYNGKAYGVQFNKGKAIISPDTIDPLLGRSVDEIAVAMQKELGYDVAPVRVPEPLLPPPPPPEPDEKPKEGEA